MLYSPGGPPGTGSPSPGYSGPPIQTSVIRPAMRGSMRNAMARSVRPAPAQ